MCIETEDGRETITLTVHGNATFLGDVNVKGTLTRGNEQAGFAVIPKEQREVRVTFKQAFAEEPIVTFSVKGAHRIDAGLNDSSKSGFGIRLTEPAPTDLTFTWVALAVPDAQTVTGEITEEPESEEEESDEPSTASTESESPASNAEAETPATPPLPSVTPAPETAATLDSPAEESLAEWEDTSSPAS